MPSPEKNLAVARWIDAGRGGGLCLEIAGDWDMHAGRIHVEGEDPDVAPASFEASGLGEFDSSLPAFLLTLMRRGDEANHEEVLRSLPDGLRGLMELALAVPDQGEAEQASKEHQRLVRLGKLTLRVWASFTALSAFLGEILYSLGRFLRGRARFRKQDFVLTLQQCGVDALPIVSLIAFLIGMIMAFVGNVQLASFGASLYVADLVAIAMVRELGVMMTAIILSGRTGAAFAAQLGSMNANEEIDALRSFGFDPHDFLVLPRVLALVLMMPILTIYANLVGILGGMMVGVAVGIPPTLYWNQTMEAVTLQTASLGVIKSVFFGMVIAVSGCMQGMNSGGSSAAVGNATTRAVVISITSIIVLDSAFAAIFTIMGI